MDREIDVFLGYKSEDANVARAVAEAIMANGHSVWLAEYRIPAHLFSDNDAIEAAINAGIDQSRCALVFTNNHWAESTFCVLEARRILDRTPAERVLEICIPPEPKPHLTFPGLTEVRHLIYQGSLSEVIEAVNGMGWFAEQMDLPAQAESFLSGKRVSVRFGVSFDPGPLEELETPELWMAGLHKPGAFTGEFYVFGGTVAGCRVQMMLNANPFSTVLGELSVHARGNANDRRVYNQYREFTAEWLDSVGQEEKGLHLQFWNQRSHLAITSVLPHAAPDHSRWERRYAIILRRRLHCICCGGTELVPYYRQDLSGEAWVPIICNNGDCRFHREIPLEDFSRDDLQMCPQCGEKDVQPDEARMRELQPDGSEGRLLCLGGGREATAADCGTRMIVPASRMGNVGEIDIALVFDLPADEQTALEEFARMAPFADAVVGSLRFAPATSVLSGDTGFVLAVKTFALLIVWCVFDYLRLRWADPATNAVFAGILGSISMDIVTACACREPRTEAVIWGMRWGWKLRVLPMPTYGRLLDRVWNTFIGSLASLMATATAGLVTVGWLAIGVGLWRHEFSLWYWGLAGAITLAAGRSARNIRPAVRQAQYYGRDRDQTPDHRRRET